MENILFEKSIVSDHNDLDNVFSQFTLLGLIIIILSTFSLLVDEVSYDEFYFFVCLGLLLIIFAILRKKRMNSIFLTKEKMIVLYRNNLIWRISFSTIKTFKFNTSLELQLHSGKLLNIEYDKLSLNEDEIKKIEEILDSYTTFR